MFNWKLDLRLMWVLMGLAGLVIVGLCYGGDALSLDGMSLSFPGGRAYPNLSAEERLARLQLIMRRSYDLWGYVRYGCIAVVVLAILGFRKYGRGQ